MNRCIVAENSILSQTNIAVSVLDYQLSSNDLIVTVTLHNTLPAHCLLHENYIPVIPIKVVNLNIVTTCEMMFFLRVGGSVCPTRYHRQSNHRPR